MNKVSLMLMALSAASSGVDQGRPELRPKDLLLSFARPGYEEPFRQVLAAHHQTLDPDLLGQALRLAADRGAIEVCRILLSSGVRADSPDDLGTTALMLAAGSGRRPTVSLLFDSGAALDRVDQHGWSAMFYAAASDQAEVVQFLLDRGANDRIIDRYGGTVLTAAWRRHVSWTVPIVGIHIESQVRRWWRTETIRILEARLPR
jgi:hypothetical protein